MTPGRKRVRSWLALLASLLVVGGAAAGIYRLRKVQADVSFPVAQARHGDFLVIVRCRGELKAARSVEIYTPMVPNLRIAWMAPSGENVQQGDPIIRFDSSSSQQDLAKKEAQLKSNSAALHACAAEKAKVQASLQAIKSKIDGEEARIALGIAKQKLKVKQATADLHAVADRS